MKLITNLSPDECKQNLLIATHQPILGSSSIAMFIYFWDLDRRYILKLKNESFVLERIYYRNAYSPLFAGIIKRHGSQTTVEGNFRMRIFPKVFNILWFGLAGVITSGLFFVILRDILNRGHAQISDLVVSYPVAMIVGGIIMTKAMKRQARQWEAELVKFLKTTLEIK